MSTTGYSQWFRPEGSGGIAVSDGTTTVDPTTLLVFTNNAVVTDAGGGEADVALVIPGSSGRIGGSSLTQLTGGGYAWSITGGPHNWDDASYFHAYGARAGGNFDSSAVVAIAPVAGRYRMRCWCEATFAAPATRTTNPHIYLIYELDAAPSLTNSFDITPALSTVLNGDQVGVEITAELYLDVNGCIGMQSIFSTSPLGHDQVVVGYQYIEYLGS